MKLKNIPCVILCGGKGTRLGKLTKKIPKPMLKISKHPILYYIISNYAKYGVEKFILLTGYKNEIINKYFRNFKGIIKKKNRNIEVFKILIKKQILEINVLYTGINTQKKDRLKKAKKIINSENFFLTYGDGLGIVNIQSQYNFHLKHKKFITLLGTHPPSRFGELIIKNNKVITLNEKPQMSQGLINGGYMVCNKKIFEKIKKNKYDLEQGVINKLCNQGEVKCYKNKNFWQCMDNEREFTLIKKLFLKNKKIKKFFTI
jgi:glucose-1-phosphate cytidylyltransferase